MLRVLGCIADEHDPWLVALAAIICAVACFTTLNLLARARSTAGRASRAWLAVAACLYGCGVWSLHFVAMLAFMPHMLIAYDVDTTLASAGIAAVGALLGFTAWQLARPRALGALLGGPLLGLAVAGMHYTGVAAMRLPGSLVLDRSGVIGSVAVGIVLATLALMRGGDLGPLRRRIEASAWLALSICGLHFTGMAALRLGGSPAGNTPEGSVLGSDSLAVTVGAVSIAILLLGLGASIMDQHLSQRTSRETRRLRRLADVALEGILIHRDGVVLEANDALCRLMEMRPEQIIGRSVLTLMPESSARIVVERLRNKVDDVLPIELEARTASGKLVPFELTARSIDYDGRPATVVATRDLSAHRRDEQRIRHLAHHDALTDLPNRSLLQERLTHALGIAARTGDSVAVLFLDLDRFKPVNDLLGHSAGDALLVQVSKRLLAELCPEDTLARVGGDEFVVVMPAAEQPRAAAALAGRILETLDNPFDIGGIQVEIGVSIGVSLYPGDGQDKDALLRNADTALYRAKAEARGTSRFFEAAMDEQLHQRTLMEQDLRHAVERGEMELHYQPLVDCRSARVEGFEALVRWRRGGRGLVPPMQFIPLAEETGLIDRIGHWVLHTACEQAAGWAEPHRIAVNLSPVQFRRAGLVRAVADALARSGLAPERLELEITESVLVDDQLRAVELLGGLRTLGVRISLDDFGTGYSSLSYLRSFPFDKIKIDKSFMCGLDEDKDAAVLVRAIIALGHNLGLVVTAEGVETRSQLDALRSLGCDQVQGYLLGRPTPWPAAGCDVPVPEADVAHTSS